MVYGGGMLAEGERKASISRSTLCLFLFQNTPFQPYTNFNSSCKVGKRYNADTNRELCLVLVMSLVKSYHICKKIVSLLQTTHNQQI